ncbi:hypothetical protein FM020_01760 [Acinetobacter tandoii]|nr:hypothetical protein FM020_01760 [Acinetobacter tandoii]
MTIYSTVTYQACNPELSDKEIYGIACKQTDQTHSYNTNKLFANLKYDLEQASTMQVIIQNNQLMSERTGIDTDFDQWSNQANDFVAREDGDLIQPFQDSQATVYLITAYGADDDQEKAEVKSIDAEFSPKQIYFTSHLDCVMDIVSILLSHISVTHFIEIERTTVENAKYQIHKRLDYVELLKPHNNHLLGHAGDYWATYQLYSNCDTEHARFDYGANYTKAQAQQALKNIKEMNSHSTPKTLAIQGCILMNQDAQNREHKKALLCLEQPNDRDRAVWVIENYNHSQSIRQAIANQQLGGHT